MRFGLTTIGLCLLLQGAPTPFIPGVNGLLWDAVAVDSLGTAVEPAPKYDVAVSVRTVDPSAGGALLRQAQVVVPSMSAAAARDLTLGLPGGEYRFWVRGVSLAGMPGVWSDPFLIEIPFTYGKVLNVRKTTE